MVFPGMPEMRFATFYVVIKQEQIRQDLGLKELYIQMDIKMVRKFVKKNRELIQARFHDEYQTLFDPTFYRDVIDFLKKKQKRGIPL